MITKHDKANLAQLCRSDVFRILQQVAQDMLTEWAGQKISSNDQFIYLREAIGREMKGQGIADFLKRLEELTKQK